MTTETLEKVGEIVKTLNLNLDGNFNSQTVSEIVTTVAPYYTFFLIKETLMQVFVGVVTILCVFKICSTILKYWRNK